MTRYPASWDKPWREPIGPMDDELRSLMRQMSDKLLAMTSKEKQAMYDAQRESFIRALGPCEHGDYDWETCAECLAKYEGRTDD